MCTRTIFNTNIVNNINGKSYNSISEFISERNLNSEHNATIAMYDYTNGHTARVSFSGSNTLIVNAYDGYDYDQTTGRYVHGPSISVYPNGSYEIKTVGDTEILILTLPDELIPEYKANEKRIYSMESGELREGRYVFADDSNNNFVWFNETAARDIYNFAQNVSSIATKFSSTSTAK